ncbi:MAG: type I-U CRISPR-associated helicase/endonuclease Cas3, partial [Planctomycetota bacterium]
MSEQEEKFDFDECFERLTTNKPFYWQKQLFQRIIKGDFPDICDVPTGLGKTSVLAIWILALAETINEKNRPIPLRLAYVVDRRVIVDQSTEEAETIIKKMEEAETAEKNPIKKLAQRIRQSTFTQDGPLIALSSLRGQKAEDREWCLDPSRPAIIIGTVDMIGSRLLFSAYGRVGRNHKSLQAGLLGQDTLVIIDEAHLSPAFVQTMKEIKKAIHQYELIRPFYMMQLSATIPSTVNDDSSTPPGAGSEQIIEKRINFKDKESFLDFDLQEENKNPEAKKRLNAKKNLEWLFFEWISSEAKKQKKEI